MPKLSYGPAAQARTQQLLMALLDYANDELWPSDDASQTEQEQFERSLDTLRPHLSTHWKSNGQSPALGERDLIIRTKIRYLEKLTQLSTLTRASRDSDQPKPLTSNQIKEALSHLGKFLSILEDNRTSRRGSDTWHFTLHLGTERRDRQGCKTWFAKTWENQHPKNLGPSPIPTPEVPPTQILCPKGELGESRFWQNLSRQDLSNRRHTQLTSNPLTAQAGLSFTTEAVYIPLEIVRQSTGAEPSSEDNHSESEIHCPIMLDDLLQQLQQTVQARTAIIGEPGAGKTTLLQQAATWILDHTPDLAIWVSLADLDDPATLETYIFETWLKTALRKRTVPSEYQDSLEVQFSQGRVWLLLDAVDEMAIATSLALTKLAQQLNGCLGEARVLITSRVNVWQGGKNALANFETYRLLGYGQEKQERSSTVSTPPLLNTSAQIPAFINRWFHDGPDTAAALIAELSRPDRQRIRDAVRNPLRLTLLCRIWSLSQGKLPETKALLYGQFVDAIYDWKQDYFPTTIAQRQQLNQALGKIALRAMQQPKPIFRLPESFVLEAIQSPEGDTDFSLIDLALQLGWLTRAGNSTDKIYRFYHATFQEYFAAQRIDRWQDLVEPPASNGEALTPIFSTAWREVILLWLGRQDAPKTSKAALMDHLISLDDDCGGFFSAQGYLLAGRGLAELSDGEQREAIGSTKLQRIANQLIRWRFDRNGRTPRALAQSTQRALSQSNPATVVAALEDFIQDPKVFAFKRWMAAYSLGKSYDPGNALAIATLTDLLLNHPGFSDDIRIELARNLGVIDPGNPTAIEWLEGTLKVLNACKHDQQLERKTALRLGLIDPGNEKAIAQLVWLLEDNPTDHLRQQLLEDLAKIAPDHPLLPSQTLPSESPAPQPGTRKQHRKNRPIDINKAVASVLARIEQATDLSAKLRLASKLSAYEPGHPIAIALLLQGLAEITEKHQLKRIATLLQDTVTEAQILEMLGTVQKLYRSAASKIEENSSTPIDWERWHVYHSILWHWSKTIPLQQFRDTWHAGS